MTWVILTGDYDGGPSTITGPFKSEDDAKKWVLKNVPLTKRTLAVDTQGNGFSAPFPDGEVVTVPLLGSFPFP